MFGGLAALAAPGVGLIALYSWVSLNYGQFCGFAAVGGVLLFVAATMFAGAMIKKKSWSAESANRAAAHKMKLVQVHAERVAAAAEPIEGPAILPVPQALRSTSAPGDLVEPLTLILSKMIKFPTLGNPLLDRLLIHVRSSARSVADQVVDGVAHAVRDGSGPQLAAALGAPFLSVGCWGGIVRTKSTLFEFSALHGRRMMSLGTVLLIILILVLLGTLPTWPYSSGWGYYPSRARSGHVEPFLQSHARACPGHPRLFTESYQERRGCPRQARA